MHTYQVGYIDIAEISCTMEPENTVTETDMTDRLVEQLRQDRDLSDRELKELIEDPSHDAALTKAADEVRRQWYGDKVYLRGLIEFTSYCKNDCLYCGLRAGNRHAERYRLSKDEILSCCEDGYALGYRTFVLQGGEDPYFTDDMICDIVRTIKERYPELDARETADELVAKAIACDAPVVVLPLQDVLGLDDTARMNTPGTIENNWIWQANAQDIAAAQGRMSELAARKRSA